MLTNDTRLIAPWVANRTESNPNVAQAAIGWLRDDDLVCGVTYDNYTGKSITATIAVEPAAVLPKSFMWAIFDYPFKQLGVWKMLAYVAESNYKSRALVEKMGFTQETVITDYYPDGDLFIYSMNKEQCRWLEKDNGQEE